jgi:PAS domain S-box-containing protein
MPLPSLTQALALVVQETENAVTITDSAGGISWVNPAFTAIVGYSLEEAIGLNPWDLMAGPGTDPKMTGAILDSLNKGGSFRSDVLLHRKSGGPLWLDMVIKTVPAPDGSIDCYIGIGVDITVRKKAEAELLKLSRAAENSPASVVITDRDGTIEYVNPKFCRLTGYSKEEVVGQNPRVLSSGAQSKEYYSRMWLMLLAGTEWQGQFLNKRKDGTIYLEHASISPVRNASGAITHFVAVKEDITERSRSMQDLAAAKEAAEGAARAKSAFLAQMSHEIRTPMNAILGFTQLLQRDTGLSAANKSMLRIITQSGEHLLSLIDDVMEMSKIEAGGAKLAAVPVDLVDLLSGIRDLFRVQAESKGLRLGVARYGEPIRHIVTDHGKLRQILINLVGNALKFTSAGFVELRIGTHRTEEGNVRLNAEIEDSGPGISRDEQDKLFHRFEQTDAGRRSGTGTGLGLAICREYVTLMGGEISVSSTPGQGSIFMFHVFVKEGQGAESEPVPMEDIADPPPEDTLVDAAALPEALRDRLRKAVLEADIEQVLQCADDAEAHDPAATRLIRNLASQYDYTALMALLGEAAE